MDKYRRVEKPKADGDIKENDIRITTQGKMRNYISYATKLFQEKQATEVILKAMGRAINKTVTIAEIIKRRIPGLHQITRMDSTDITDVWEPLEDGLDRVETVRHVSSIQITLSTKQLDTSDIGYQPPLSADQVKPLSTYEGPARPRVRGRGRFSRGGRGGAQPQPGGEQLTITPLEQRPRRGGRGRGRGFSDAPHQNQQPHQPQQAAPQQPQNAPQQGHQNFQGPPRGGFRSYRGGRGGIRGRGRGRGMRGRGRGSVPPRQQDGTTQQ